MKKAILLLIGLMFTFTIMGCTKEHKEPYLNLLYDRFTSMTNLVDYEQNGSKISCNYVMGNSYKIIKQNSELEYKSSNNIDKCTLLIQNAETKEKVKESTLTLYKINTDVPQGKYIYTFSTQGENSSGKFIELIEIK